MLFIYNLHPPFEPELTIVAPRLNHTCKIFPVLLQMPDPLRFLETQRLLTFMVDSSLCNSAPPLPLPKPTTSTLTSTTTLPYPPFYFHANVLLLLLLLLPPTETTTPTNHHHPGHLLLGSYRPFSPNYRIQPFSSPLSCFCTPLPLNKYNNG